MSQMTRCGTKSMHESIGIPKKSCQRLADIALKDGIRHSETCGSLNKYITALYFVHETANQIRLYGDKTYLFAGDTLITVIPTPKKYLKTVNKLQAEKRRKNLISTDSCTVVKSE